MGGGMGVSRWICIVALAVATLALGACHSVGYYAQAARGQSAILLKRQPINRLLADTDLDPELRGRLELVVEAREFAAAELGLPSDGSYSTYVDPGRQHMLWNVFAAPADSLEPVLCVFLLRAVSAIEVIFPSAPRIAMPSALSSKVWTCT